MSYKHAKERVDFVLVNEWLTVAQKHINHCGWNLAQTKAQWERKRMTVVS